MNVHFRISNNQKEEFVTLAQPAYGETRADQIEQHCIDKLYNLKNVRVIESSNKRIDLSLAAYSLGLR